MTQSNGKRTLLGRILPAPVKEFAKRVYLALSPHALYTLLGRSYTLRRIQPLLDRRGIALARLLRTAPFRAPEEPSFISRRVVLAVSSLSSGGAERQVVVTARGLRQSGVEDVHILAEHLTGGTNAFYLPAAKKGCASVTELTEASGQDRDLRGRFRALYFVGHLVIGRRVLGAARFLADMKPEIVHISLDWTNATVGLAACLAGVPRIFISGRNLAPWHFSFFNWFLYPSYRALVQQPSVVLLNNSEAGARDYERWLGLRPNCVRVLRNGFDGCDFVTPTAEMRAEARASFGIPADTVLIAGLFRFSPEKRPMLWLDCAARILQKEPRARFLLSGDGPLRNAMERVVKQRGLADRFLLTGVIAKTDPVYLAADLVLLTSLQEGTPNVLLEAQALGVPVVTTKAFGAAEAVEDGVTGRVARDETPEGIATAVLEVMRDAAFRDGARKAGPAFVERNFGLKRMTVETLRLYADHGAIWARP